MVFLLLLCTSAFAGILDVEIIDVGQGDSILIRTPAGKVVLIDGGTGQTDVVSELRSRQIDSINLLVATHPHADHIGGIDEVLSEISVRNYLDNGMTHTTKSYAKVMELVEAKDVTYIVATNGRQFNLDDDITLSIIHPQDKALRNTRSDLNSNSVVLRMTHGDNCFLFTGDAEEPTEDLLVQKGIEPCDVLKVAHHGSNHSSSMHFLNAVQPKIALISAGKNNRYGHPGEEALSRIEKTGATIYRTDQLGTIHLQSDGKSIDILEKSKDNTPNPYTDVEISFQPPAQDEEPLATSLNADPDKKGEAGHHEQTFDINTATKRQLESIPGIGPAKANAIIDYRDTNGPFTSHSDLKNVHGIGEKLSQTIERHTSISEE